MNLFRISLLMLFLVTEVLGQLKDSRFYDNSPNECTLIESKSIRLKVACKYIYQFPEPLPCDSFWVEIIGPNSVWKKVYHGNYMDTIIALNADWLKHGGKITFRTQNTDPNSIKTIEFSPFAGNDFWREQLRSNFKIKNILGNRILFGKYFSSDFNSSGGSNHFKIKDLLTSEILDSFYVGNDPWGDIIYSGGDLIAEGYEIWTEDFNGLRYYQRKIPTRDLYKSIFSNFIPLLNTQSYDSVYYYAQTPTDSIHFFKCIERDCQPYKTLYFNYNSIWAPSINGNMVFIDSSKQIHWESSQKDSVFFRIDSNYSFNPGSFRFNKYSEIFYFPLLNKSTNFYELYAFDGNQLSLIDEAQSISIAIHQNRQTLIKIKKNDTTTYKLSKHMGSLENILKFNSKEQYLETILLNENEDAFIVANILKPNPKKVSYLQTADGKKMQIVTLDPCQRYFVHKNNFYYRSQNCPESCRVFILDTTSNDANLSNIHKTMLQSESTNITKPDFEQATQMKNQFQKIRITSLPKNGFLTIDSIILKVIPPVVYLDEFKTISYTPYYYFKGQDSFSWEVSDGRAFIDKNAEVVINVQENPNLNLKPFAIRPNPGSNQIYVKGQPNINKEAIIQVSTIEGKVLEEYNFEATKEIDYDFELNISFLNPGIYLLYISQGKFKATEKFVKF